MTAPLITDPAQIDEVWQGMEVEDAAKRAKALPIQAAEHHADLVRLLDFQFAVVAPNCTPDQREVLTKYLALSKEKAQALADVPQQAADVLVNSAFLVMKLMRQRNAKTAELAALIEALESGNEAHPLLTAFADRLDEQRNDYTHLEQLLGDEPAGVMADLFLGRGTVEPEALGGLIMALVQLYERKTGQVVTVLVNEATEAQSA